jgi:integrase
VAKYRPHVNRRIIRDLGARSLFLVVHPSGAMSWQMRFRTPSGRIGKMTLGPVDHSGHELSSDPAIGQPLTLAAARALSADVQRQRAMGLDPVADAKTRRARHRAVVIEGAKNSFGAAAKDFIEQYASKRVRRWKEQARLLGLQPKNEEGLDVIPNGLAQRWNSKPIAEIDGHDIHAIVAETRERGVPGLERRSNGPTEARARAMLSCLSRMFRWLWQHRRVERNPCVDVHRPETPKDRHRLLTNAEIVAFWKATDAAGEPFASVLKLLLLTGCRLNEIAGLHWEELSGDMLDLPGERTKNHRPHVVPLAPLARAIVERAPRIRDCVFVFSTTGRTPVSGWSKAKRRLDAAMLTIMRKANPAAQLPPWRIHDLRRTTVTGMGELGIRDDVIELVVNHVSGHRGGIAGVYNKSKLLPERKAALARWAAHLQGVVARKPANTVPMPMTKRRS